MSKYYKPVSNYKLSFDPKKGEKHTLKVIFTIAMDGEGIIGAAIPPPAEGAAPGLRDIDFMPNQVRGEAALSGGRGDDADDDGLLAFVAGTNAFSFALASGAGAAIAAATAAPLASAAAASSCCFQQDRRILRMPVSVPT